MPSKKREDKANVVNKQTRREEIPKHGMCIVHALIKGNKVINSLLLQAKLYFYHDITVC